ncbi:hypothetical protein Y1Q_0020678 [Alligator mississippiensis]|uniref:Uncharacterized protein n=1 Tax=Alligator mississippiensis TaxID=8496 RepID=A0A151MVY2_ALLMI|nr:hypothetical protein Y1Q_0020678 [Alligator mississippiensis]
MQPGLSCSAWCWPKQLRIPLPTPLPRPTAWPGCCRPTPPTCSRPMQEPRHYLLAWTSWWLTVAILLPVDCSNGHATSCWSLASPRWGTQARPHLSGLAWLDKVNPLSLGTAATQMTLVNMQISCGSDRAGEREERTVPGW